MTPEELAELEKRAAAEAAAGNANNVSQGGLEQESAPARQPTTSPAQAESAGQVGGARSSADLGGSTAALASGFGGAAPAFNGTRKPNPSGIVVPPVVVKEEGDQGSSAGFDEIEETEDFDEGMALDAAGQRALELIMSGQTLTEEELARQRESANARTAQEVADLKARSGAGGFGVSFASEAAIADIARIGERETELSLDESKRAARDEQLQRILQGAQLARATSGEGRTAEQEALINQLIQQTLNEGDPGASAAEFQSVLDDPNATPEEKAVAQEALDSRALNDASMAGIGGQAGVDSLLEGGREALNDFFLGNESSSAPENFDELSPSEFAQGGWEWVGQETDGQGQLWSYFEKTENGVTTTKKKAVG